jgi:hypothetical protein
MRVRWLGVFMCRYGLRILETNTEDAAGRCARSNFLQIYTTMRAITATGVGRDIEHKS